MMQDKASKFQCFPCQDQEYDGEDSFISVPTDLCIFHGQHGPRAKREDIPRWREGLEGATVTPIDPQLRQIRPGMKPEEISKLVLGIENALEQGLLIWRIHQVADATLLEISEYCGKSGPWAAMKARLGRLVPSVQEMIKKDELQVGMGKHLGLVPQMYQEIIAREMIKKKLTLNSAKKYIKERLRELQQSGPQPRPEAKKPSDGASEAAGSREALVRRDPEPYRAPVSILETDTLRLVLRSLGEADRLMSVVGELTFRDLMDAFQTPEDLRAARSQLLTTAHRLNELENFLEHIRRARFPTLPGIRREG